MRRSLRNGLVLLLGVLLLGLVARSAANNGTSSTVHLPLVLRSPTTAPATIYWGAYIEGVPWDMSKLEAFEARAGKRVSIVHFGQPWQYRGAMQAFPPTSLLDAIRTHGAIPMINWGSWHLGYGSEQPDYQLSDIYNGRYDAYIRAWAQAAKAWNKPLFMRFNHEMNGWWQFPWSEKLNGNQPGDYVKAWRHVHGIFAAVGATNVTWVWSPNIISAETTPLANVYPGAAYVDWVAMDGYNFGAEQGNKWTPFADVFGPTYKELLRLAPGKPMMIAETASSEKGGSKAAWIKDALEIQLPQHFPEVKAIVWFNWNAEPGRTWLIESSLPAQEAFRAAIGKPVYATNTFATLTTSPIPPARR